MKNHIRNAAKLDPMLSKAQGRARTRTINLEQIEAALDRISDRLFTVSTKKDAAGTKVVCNIHAQKYPNAYRRLGTPESTFFIATYKSTGWVIDSVFRAECGTCFACITYTDATKAHMAERLAEIR